MRALAALLFGFATHVFAQSPPPPSTPSEPHEKLAFFEGEWTVAGMEAQKFRETCRWMFHRRTRVTITATAEGMRFVEESATDDGPWKAGPEIPYLRTAR